jgi:hypothetical protein
MRSRNAAVALAVLVAGVGTVAALQNEHALAVPDLDPAGRIFDGRALVPPLGVGPATAATFKNSPIAKLYDSIDPARSILISDCQHLINCDNPGFLSFQSIFGVVAAAGRAVNNNAPDGDALYASLFQTLGQAPFSQTVQSQFGSTLPNAGFQLLAIANRLDMAAPDQNGLWTGAEIHFIYGLTQGTDTTGNLLPPPQVTAILEFMLAPPGNTGFTLDQFLPLAQAWCKLSAKDVNAANYSGKLQTAVGDSGLPLGGGKSWVKCVRLRINQSLGARWQFAQVLLDPNVSPNFAPAKLNDQIKGGLAADAQAVLWTMAQASLATHPGAYPIPPGLLEDPSHPYLDLDPDIGMSMPPGFCGTAQTREVLAIQQCTFCHTSETGTMFQHIQNRGRGGSSQLSTFLQGHGPDTFKPSLIDLYNNSTSVAPKVSVGYQTFPVANCKVPAPPAVHQFHDIARRTLFLAALLNTSTAKGRKNPGQASQFSSQSIE